VGFPARLRIVHFPASSHFLSLVTAALKLDFEHSVLRQPDKPFTQP
jgi:hypothetical protein